MLSVMTAGLSEYEKLGAAVIVDDLAAAAEWILSQPRFTGDFSEPGRG